MGWRCVEDGKENKEQPIHSRSTLGLFDRNVAWSKIFVRLPCRCNSHYWI